MKLNADQFMSFVRSVLKIGGGVLSANGVNQNSVTQIILGIVSAIVALIWSHLENATPTVQPAPVTITKAPVFFLIAMASVMFGCATLNKGADPLVVRAEQAELGAEATFDLILHLDNADRGYWRTNAPAFHHFAEWLRTPQQYATVKTNVVVARAVAMQLNVDDLKLEYKQVKTVDSSNSLFLAWATLNAAMGQANSWSNIISNPVHP